MISILVYPNITYAKDLEKDSYVVVLHNIIEHLNKRRGDIEWTILSPRPIKSLEFENVVQRPITLPTYPNQMRLHFDSWRVINSIGWKENDYDLVYSHLPEHTLQLKNLFYNETNLTPQFIGYAHWFEIPEVTDYKETVLPFNIWGILAMRQCGINTQAQKDLVLKNAEKILDGVHWHDLALVLRPQYLGWEQPLASPSTNLEKTIVFNHRAHTYKNYPWFISQMDRLWQERQDFKVWVPLADSKHRDYMDISKYDRKEYFERLSKCWVGVAAKQKYAGWSVSATDGMSVGVPYLFADEGYYHELAGDHGIYYKNEEEFNKLIHTILDSREERMRLSGAAHTQYTQCTWDKQIVQFDKMIDSAVSSQRTLKEPTAAYKKIYECIRKNGRVTKKALLAKMRWGVRVTWSSYRNRLRKDGVITHRNYYEFKA